MNGIDQNVNFLYHLSCIVMNSLMRNWRRLLYLESKHGALGGRKPKVLLLMKILEQVSMIITPLPWSF